MSPAQLNTLINKKCKTNDTTFPQADKLVFANVFKDEISSLISQRNNKYFILPETQNLVADQRNYTFPSNLLNHIYAVEASFTTTTPLAYVKVLPIGRWSLNHALTEAKITDNFRNEDPRYFIRDKEIYILSGTIIAVTNGLRIYFRKYPDDLTNMTGSTDMATDPSATAFGFPRQFHELLARRISIEYKDINEIKLSSKENNYEIDLEKQLQATSRESQDENITGSVPKDNGEKY